MNWREAKKIVEECLSKLPKADRRRLGFHAEMGTRILTSSAKNVLFDPTGKVHICVLSATRKIPSNPTIGALDRWKKRQAFLKGLNSKFENAVSSLSEKSMRTILSNLK